jgi:uncharacterized membrane protein
LFRPDGQVFREAGAQPRTSSGCNSRMLNEVPAITMAAIVILVVVKPF